MEQAEYYQHCPRSKLGMDIFLSQHKGFLGSIKTRPGDFRVTEIDLSGKPVQLEKSGDFQGLPSAPCHVKAKEGRSDGDGSKIGGNSSCRIPDGLSVSSKIVGSTSFDDLTELESLTPIFVGIIGVQVMEDLGVFSERELRLNDPSSKTTVRTSDPVHGPVNSQNSLAEDGDTSQEKCFCIGVVQDKEARTFVHKAVQCLFPHLKTSTSKLPDDTSKSVSVSTNPTYWDFRNLLEDLQVGKLIRFAGSKFSTRTFSIDAEGTDSKETRTAIHRLISKHFGKFLETKTCRTASGKQEVVVRFREKFARKDSRGVKRKADATETEGSGDVFTGFTLKKSNLETLDALQKLARVLRVQPSDFSYAGVKDKKAVTLQSVAVKGINSKRLEQLINVANLPGITVGNIHPRIAPIHVGDLTGNLFDILIRDIRHRGDGEPIGENRGVEGALLKEELDTCFASVKEKGFMNYFGEQRFGLLQDGKSQSAAIGQSILSGKYQDAVNQILAPEEDKDDPVNRAKRHFLQTRNAKEALALMPRHKTRECLVLRALHRHGLDRDGCMRALLCIPHAMRQFYAHAFCSLVWNHMASVRLRLYGYRVVAGDLVLMGDEKRGARDKIQEVSEDDVKAGIFSIQDVVLPLPGNNIRYPSNRMGDAYTKYLEGAGLGSCKYRPTELQLNIPGDYRRLIEWPKELRWDLEHIRDDDEIQTNLVPDKLGMDCEVDSKEDRECLGDERATLNFHEVNLKCSNDSSEIDGQNPPESNNDDISLRSELSSSELDEGNSPSDRQATGVNLRVKFRLASSTYATVFLRELMKKYSAVASTMLQQKQDEQGN
ncbi:pseudouridylate synthase 7 homolog-like protein [Patiria miniata]|uniref:TRUD domain-containing protein n=1 Tax=Patiria miniata TaxID=46514 RepID=A0A914AY29_PATMI|nr:pseudouridylate synthase 7 homolog-like protein [Patiria miniata]XP_038069051.1 pseudouridylate synthase 7 homolog-like protein [Patiria miniata]XP_038069052.1 pseudouridylate synthase 7 homolog-like protein [Patiria miniata]